jgi:hypothetical protein
MPVTAEPSTLSLSDKWKRTLRDSDAHGNLETLGRLCEGYAEIDHLKLVVYESTFSQGCWHWHLIFATALVCVRVMLPFFITCHKCYCLSLCYGTSRSGFIASTVAPWRLSSVDATRKLKHMLRVGDPCLINEWLDTSEVSGTAQF